MEEVLSIQDERFIRVKDRKVFTGERSLQTLFKVFLKISFQILLFLLFSFLCHELYIQVLEDPYFSIKEIEVKGCKRLQPDTIISLAKIEGIPNIFSFKLHNVAERIALNPWIENLEIRKIFPDKIFIQIEEKKPIAIIHLEKFYYIDSKGIIFAPVTEGDRYNYPILTGIPSERTEDGRLLAEDLVIKGIEFLRIVEQNKLPPVEEISEIYIDKDFGIHLVSMNDGVEVRIGWDHFEEKLKRLSIIWIDLKKRGYLPLFIDCSDLKRMVVKKVNHR
jgi:cell division protein FtsQ